MSRAAHPAGKRRRCSLTGCDEAPTVRVAVPGAFAIVRPLDSPNPVGDPVCLDHAHHAVDVMLMRATPEPAR